MRAGVLDGRRRVRFGRAVALAAAAIVSTTWLSTSAVAAPPDDSSSSIYIALGDSLAAGFPPATSCTGVHETNPCNGYAGVLFSRYQSSLGVTHMLNHGSPGATSSGFAGQASTAATEINAASDTKAVTIDIGGNDLNLGGGPPCTDAWDSPSCPLRANLAGGLATIKSALDADDGGEIFAIMGYYNPEVGLSREAFYERNILGANGTVGLGDSGADVGINDVIMQEAIAAGASYSDPYPTFRKCGNAFISSDLRHPTVLGNVAVASAFPGGPAAPACPPGGGGGGDDTLGPATASVAGGLVKLKGHTFDLVVSCVAGGETCQGTVSVQTAKPVSIRAGASKRKKVIALGSSSFYVAAGYSRPVEVRLPKKGKKLFKAKRKVKAVVDIAVHRAGGDDTATSPLTIKGKKPKKR